MNDPTGRPLVVALVANLFFAAPIGDAARAAGAEAVIVEDVTTLAAAIERWPALVVIDLAVPSDWQPIVRRAKLLPQTRAIPIVAFGSHVEGEALRAARAAGCDHAWARSRFMAELPELVRRAVQPAGGPTVGWDEPPPPALRAAVVQFNTGAYWECHETLEVLWRAEERPIRDLYQGILQVGVACHHLRAGNYAGTIKMLRRGLPRLRGLPDVCQGVPVAELARAARAMHDQVLALGPEATGQFDLKLLPRIQLVEAPDAGHA